MTAEPADKLLVVGADGLLGSTLMNLAREQGQPALGTALAPAPGSDLVRLDLDAWTDEWTPPPGCRAAVLCAAITSLDACRRNPAATRRINVEQTLRLARRLAERDIFVTFISSNLVFDGSASRVPADAPTRPQTEYGRQKAEVEAGLAELGAHAAVVRLTKVMHSRWALFEGWIDSLRKGRAIQPFADFVCAPIPLSLVALGLTDIARGRRAGIWQFSADADVSYADIARHLALRLGAGDELVQPGRSAAHATLEHSPAHTTLNATRAREQLGLTFPPPMEAIHQAFRA